MRNETGTTPQLRGRPKSGENRREEIIKNLTDLFLKEGFRQPTVEAISKACGCSRRTLYTFASSKNEIFLFVLEKKLRQIRQRGIEDAAAVCGAEEKINAALNAGLKEFANTTPTFFADVESFLPAKQLLEDHLKKRIEALQELLRQGIEEGVFRPVPTYLVADMLLSFALRFKSSDSTATYGYTGINAIADFMDITLNGIKVRTN